MSLSHLKEPQAGPAFRGRSRWIWPLVSWSSASYTQRLRCYVYCRISPIFWFWSFSRMGIGPFGGFELLDIWPMQTRRGRYKQVSVSSVAKSKKKSVLRKFWHATKTAGVADGRSISAWKARDSLRRYILALSCTQTDHGQTRSTVFGC